MAVALIVYFNSTIKERVYRLYFLKGKQIYRNFVWGFMLRVFLNSETFPDRFATAEQDECWIHIHT